ncbi:DUF7282 domain-containing protein [Salinilacihabitans rarus]|uniref:DUF7282 domain-containing protein n=1 Tax=Salinilacihabitans rarus TaxID=2961596 RepID=UPI0020C8F074|nr:DUF4179 domain-containing protein [Salinilacihabitans rarus]
MTTRLATAKRLGAVLIAVAVVLAAAAIVGQAPEIFGAEPEEPEASIEFEDQTGNGTDVTIDAVETSDGGFVVITDGAGETVAVSEYVEAGDHENVTVAAGAADEEGEAELFGQLTATVHRDTDGNESYDYDETDGEADVPYLEDGYPVSDTATITRADRSGGPGNDSFVVESLDAPATAGTNETIEVAAEIRNPTDFENRQRVEFRLDGAVLERRVLDLSADESREVTFEIDLAGAEPGTHTIGVYTAGDGELSEIDLAYEGEPRVAVVAANASSVTVDAALPEAGFVAVENDSGETIGTGGELDPGEHGNVTVGFDRAVEENETLTATLLAGDPTDPEAATPFAVDGDPVEATFTVGDAGTDADADGAGNESASNESDADGA